MKGAPARPFVERWNWVQFSCAFAFVGVVAFLHVDWPLDGLVFHLIKTFVIASVFGCIAGRFGDWAWAGIGRRLWFL